MPMIDAYDLSGSVQYFENGSEAFLQMCCRWQRILNSTIPFVLLVPAYCVRLSVPMLCSFALGPQPMVLHAPQQSILAVCCQVDVGGRCRMVYLEPPQQLAPGSQIPVTRKE